MNRSNKKTIIVPLDHGVTVGPIKGLINLSETVDKIAEGGANAVIGHLGLPLYGHRQSGKDIGLILHLSASTTLSPDPNAKVLVNNVNRAIKMGADGVSIHINIGAEDEKLMLKDFGNVVEECMEWGMPLIAMMYPRGKKINKETDISVVKHAARVGAELGADIIKTNYTGSIASFEEVIKTCPAPVIIAGGEKMETDLQLLQTVYDANKAGAAGISIGRNIFQHDDPEAIIKAIAAIIHQNETLKFAIDLLKYELNKNKKKNGQKKK